MSPRFEVFTQRHGDVVATTRFHFVARLVTRFIRTLEYDHPIPLLPVPQNGLPDHSECSICGSLVGCSCSIPGWINGQDEGTEPDEPEEYDASICPDCGHDYYHDAQGRCMYPLEDRVCGWHPDVMGPVPCETRVETPESLEAGRMCYEGRCPRCRGEGCREYWLGFKKAEREYVQELRDHDCEKSGCGPVCTAFES